MIAANILSLARECLEPFECPYDVFVSNGDPPADCSSISAHWRDAQIDNASNQCHTVINESLEVTLIRCCQTNDTMDFDPVKEDADARCFLRDFGNLFECLVCRVKEVLGAVDSTCANPFVQIASAEGVQGGCATGRIIISFQHVQNCCAFT